MEELDRQVAEALGWKHHGMFYYSKTNIRGQRVDEFHPSINGQQAMDLVREFKLSVVPVTDGRWTAEYPGKEYKLKRILVGPTPEIAICKAVVASKGGSDE